ncbi:MAG: SDR family oxidoreductase [Bacteroidales bacterium]|nr:SDR family oxidoreductase [Bacteroidales bacterium]
MKLLDGKVALVTGASRGIGAATALLFAKHGAKVAINYFSEADKGYTSQAAELVSEIKQAGGLASAYDADITNRQQVLEMVQNIENEYGTITTLAINAYIPFNPAPFIDLSWEMLESKVVSDLKAVFFVSQAVIPGMIKNQSGSIIAVSSGLSRTPTYDFAAYSASKSALNSLVRSMALELGCHGIRVNTVAPGFTNTDANRHVPEQNREHIAQNTPLRRTAFPLDIANAILFYAMDQSQFISGGYMPVDGGLTML